MSRLIALESMDRNDIIDWEDGEAVSWKWL
jgi:hypothetical protein